MSGWLDGRVQRVKELVERVFAAVPEARSNKNLLVLEYWRQFELGESSEAKGALSGFLYLLGPSGVKSLTSVDLITRVARILQNEEEKWEPDEETKSRRRKAGEKMGSLFAVGGD